MIPLLINGQNLHGRPIEFDSDVANQKTMENAFGNPVKPTKISTCCPDCGQGLEFDLTLGDPPYSSVEVTCYICNPAAPPPVDPFMNPLEDGRVPGHDLDHFSIIQMSKLLSMKMTILRLQIVWNSRPMNRLKNR